MIKQTAAVLCFGLAAAAFAAPKAVDPLEIPPVFTEEAAAPAAAAEPRQAPRTVQMPAAKADEQAMMSLAPNDSDMKKAREDREKGKVPQKIGNRTTVETHRDVSNRVTEIVVTPGSTKIPYTIKNRENQPIETGPAGTSQGTLGTPKFIEFGW